jgi:SAM-dependent methyltransferase
MNIVTLINSVFSGQKTRIPPTPSFITNDAFEGIELVCSREAIARFYLKGKGVEIGALHKPLKVDTTKASVVYVDYKSLEENRERYPELENETIVETDIIDDGFILSTVADESFDFLVANHALEHSPDPLGTLGVWLGKIKAGGLLYMAVPIADKCYDKGREITSLDHFYEDQEDFRSINKKKILRKTRMHILDFISISGNNIRVMNNLGPVTEEEKLRLTDKLTMRLQENMKSATDYAALIDSHVTGVNRKYDIHYHTFTPTTYEQMLTCFCEDTGSILENVIKNGNGECIGIIRKNYE